MVVHESVSKVPSGFTVSGTPSPSQEIQLLVALVQSNIAGLAAVVDAVSTPSSPSYGKYLTAEEIAEYVKPAAATLSTVTDWIKPNVSSVKPYTPAGDILQISLSVSQAEALFNTKFSTYTWGPTGPQIIRALNYSLPSTLNQHILHVHPIVAFSPPPKSTGSSKSPDLAYGRNVSSEARALERRQLAPCEDIVQPACLLDFYGLPNKTISGSTTNKIGVQGYNSPGDGAYANLADLQTFLNEFRPDLAGNTFNLVTLNGAENLQDHSGTFNLEGQIDIQYTVGVAGDVPITYLLDERNADPAVSYMDTINWLLTQTQPPTVFSTSYANEEGTFTQSAATSVCNGYMQVAAMGISMLFGSGDGGASDNQMGCTSFVPMFPASCPYVTSVGGTFFQPPTAFTFSGGGFSNYFPAPSYQTAAISTYLGGIGNTNAGFYNPSGRGIPDVASEWEVYVVDRAVGGTSCATPIFSSFIALINDRLIAAGKPTLGFLNPLLYGAGKAGLDDVTTGESRGCSSARWTAAAGWDPVTGLGTPDFPAMLAALGI
ncbi:subtilisin-like protein, partial [Roridomyces roridus]